MQIILEEVQQALASVTELRYISLDWGQLDLINPPVQFPCAIVLFEGADYSDYLIRRQKADATLVVSLAHLPPHQPSLNASNHMKNEYYKIFDIIDKVNKVLVNTRLTNSISLIRQKLKAQRRDDGIVHYEITYRFSYTEDLS